MDDTLTETIGIFTISCRCSYNDFWWISLHTESLHLKNITIHGRDRAVLFFDTKCIELKKLLEDWDDTSQRPSFSGDDILYSD